MRPKSFVIIFITYVYTIDIPTMGSHRDNMCFVFTKFIVIVLDCTISFSLWWTMVKMAIHTQKCKQKWLKINNKGVGGGIKMSWVEKNRKVNNRETTIIRDWRVFSLLCCKYKSDIYLIMQDFNGWWKFNNIFINRITTSVYRLTGPTRTYKIFETNSKFHEK